MTLLVYGRNVAVDETEELSTRVAAKATKRLLLHFNDTKVTLGLSIVKRNMRVMQKGENLSLMSVQVIE